MSYSNVIALYSNGSNAVELDSTVPIASRKQLGAEIVPFKKKPIKEPKYGIKTLVICAISVAMLAASVFLFLFGDAMRRDSAMARTDFEQIVVETGDTLWTISEQRPVDGISLSEEVYELKKLNGLDSSAIVAGQTLLVPIADL
jgi:hypothetical protein